MLQQQTLSLMNSLKLLGMARSFEERLKSAQAAGLSHAEFVGLLVQDEKTYRDNRRLTRLLKGAKLRLPAALEDVDYAHPRALNKQLLLELANPAWITDGKTVLLTGPAGVGKSFLACALGNAAARSGFTVLYQRASRLFETLHQSSGDGSHLKMLARLAKVQLLIIDDFLLKPLTDDQRSDLLEIVEDRYQTAGTVLSGQLPVRDWHDAIGEPTIADAVLDRLVHGAFKIELKGESIRKKKAA